MNGMDESLIPQYFQDEAALKFLGFQLIHNNFFNLFPPPTKSGM